MKRRLSTYRRGRRIELRAQPPTIIQLGFEPLFQDQQAIDAKIDTQKGIVRDVSVITKGEAIGHDLIIDDKTLVQMLECAKRSPAGVMVKADHGSGVGAIFGKLINFKIRENKLRADLVLFKRHANYEQTLEQIRNLYSVIGLSVSFEPSPNKETAGTKNLARCAKILSVDLVGTPAANPDGLLEAKHVDTKKQNMKNLRNGKPATGETPEQLRARKAELEKEYAELAAALGEDTESGEDEDQEDSEGEDSEDADETQAELEDEEDEDSDLEDGEDDEQAELEDEDDEEAYQDSYEREDAALARQEARALSRGDQMAVIALGQERRLLKAEFQAAAAQRQVTALQQGMIESAERVELAAQQAEEQEHLTTIQTNMKTMKQELAARQARIVALEKELRTPRQEPVSLSSASVSIAHMGGDYNETITQLQAKHKCSRGKAIELANKENPEARLEWLVSIGAARPGSTIRN